MSVPGTKIGFDFLNLAESSFPQQNNDLEFVLAWRKQTFILEWHGRDVAELKSALPGLLSFGRRGCRIPAEKDVIVRAHDNREELRNSRALDQQVNGITSLSEFFLVHQEPMVLRFPLAAAVSSDGSGALLPIKLRDASTPCGVITN